jgi:hypothetical protein
MMDNNFSILIPEQRYIAGICEKPYRVLQNLKQPGSMYFNKNRTPLSMNEILPVHILPPPSSSPVWSLFVLRFEAS